jgi:hypothetical protein
MRAVFSLDGGCSVPKLPVLVITFLVFVLILAVRVVLLLVARKQKKAVPLDAAGGVSKLAGLAREHAWIGAVMPCHVDCGPIHTTVLFVHVVIIMAVASGLLTAFPASSSDDTFVIAFAIAAAFAAAAARPVTGVLFDMHRVVDQRLWYVGRIRAGDACDLNPHGVEVCADTVGVSRDTLQSMRSIPFDRMHGFPYKTKQEVSDEEQRAAFKTAREAELLATSVTVQLGFFRPAGFALCAVVSIVAMFVVFSNTAPWCGARWSTYILTLLTSLAIDVVVVQPIFVLFVWMWRWVISEEEDGRAVHKLHPIDGQRRVVGQLWDDRVEAADDAETVVSDETVASDDVSPAPIGTDIDPRDL